jgi:hypothetical protein
LAKSEFDAISSAMRSDIFFQILRTSIRPIFPTRRFSKIRRQNLAAA